jgi:hypothetical protein
MCREKLVQHIEFRSISNVDEAPNRAPHQPRKDHPMSPSRAEDPWKLAFFRQFAMHSTPAGLL